MKSDINWREPYEWHGLKFPKNLMQVVLLIHWLDDSWSTEAAMKFEGIDGLLMDGPMTDFAMYPPKTEKWKRFAIVDIQKQKPKKKGA